MKRAYKPGWVEKKGHQSKDNDPDASTHSVYTEKSTCAGWPVYRMDVGMSSSKSHRGGFEPEHAGPDIVR